MTNLIPREAKRAARREYILRTLSVWALLLAGVLASIALIFLPTYVLLAARGSALQIENQEFGEQEGAYQEARTKIEEANTIASILNQGVDLPVASVILDHIETARGGAIELEGFSYTRNEKGVLDLSIQGTAATREALVSFRDALESDPLFDRATIPVSDLARDVDAPFSMTLIVSTESNP